MRPHKQRGVALITVLLIFSVITVMASRMVTDLWVSTQKSSRYLERMQARFYALGAEQYVALMLEQDALADRQSQRQVDHPGESWNLERVDYDIDQGQIDILLRDEQGLFNMNSLAAHDNSGLQSQRIFQNLLSQKGINPQQADLIKDWIDSDLAVSPNGAEDNSYLIQERPRRTGNTDMVSLSEMRLIRGQNKAEAMALRQSVSVLQGTTRINVNTAPRSVLLALSSELTESDVDAVLQARSDRGLSKLSELVNIPSLSGKASLLQAAPLAFHSQHFSALIRARYRDTTYQVRTWFYRTGHGQVQISRREMGPSQYWPEYRDKREGGA